MLFELVKIAAMIGGMVGLAVLYFGPIALAYKRRHHARGWVVGGVAAWLVVNFAPISTPTSSPALMVALLGFAVLTLGALWAWAFFGKVEPIAVSA